MKEPPFALREMTVVVVGLGLMGGSLALALRARHACKKILAVTRNPASRERALDEKIVDEASDDLRLVAEADAIILAAPVRAIVEQLPLVGQMARAGTVIMDLGSTKCEIVRAMQALPDHVDPLGAHPMCGKETAGLAAADANLYRHATFVLTPLARTSPAALAWAESLVRTLDARPLILDPARHDALVAVTSHLPFVLASTLMTTADELASADDWRALAASGFRDTSRLAASDTIMMLDILLTNRENVAAAARASSRHLNELADLIEAADEIALHAQLEQAALNRRHLKFDI